MSDMPAARWGRGRAVTTSFRMTEDEARMVRGRAEGVGLTPSEFIRRLALTPEWRPLGAGLVEQLRGLKIQLRLAGSNLNQLTRQTHLVGLGSRPAAGLSAELAAAIAEVRVASAAVASALGEVVSDSPSGRDRAPGSGGSERATPAHRRRR